MITLYADMARQGFPLALLKAVIGLLMKSSIMAIGLAKSKQKSFTRQFGFPRRAWHLRIAQYVRLLLRTASYISIHDVIHVT